MNRRYIPHVRLCLVVSAFSLVQAANAAFKSPENIIVQAEAISPSDVYAVDLDGDGDLDVLSASWGDDKIAWYANDGTGRFGSQQIITSLTYLARSVYAADLDGDGDLDVLSASAGDDRIAWYANDGTGQFGSQQVITDGALRADFVCATDLDGDGDLDVLSLSKRSVFSQADKIAWYANDGTGQFGPEQVITTFSNGAGSIHAVDLDGDADLDILSVSRGGRGSPSTIAWHANDGTGQFGPEQVVTTLGYEASAVCAADLDSDGDLDVLSASLDDNKIAWYANDGAGQFGSRQVITTWADGAGSLYAADLDGDGSLDVISVSARDDKLAWCANNGTGLFEAQQVITTTAKGLSSVQIADLDGDDDLDVLSASLDDNKLAWYENDSSVRSYFLVVDDFEQYNEECNRIFFAWQDGPGHNGGQGIEDCNVPPSDGNGGGSVVGCDWPACLGPTVAHSGAQSMPFFYNNQFGPSEATRSFPGQDWSSNGIQTLSMVLYGEESNTGQLYIKINDTKIVYEGDPGDITRPEWQVWNVDLTAVSGIQNVQSLTIGVDGASAAGTLYIDDIRLYPLPEESIIQVQPDDSAPGG